jgi:hypothetical protein
MSGQRTVGEKADRVRHQTPVEHAKKCPVVRNAREDGLYRMETGGDVEERQRFFVHKSSAVTGLMRLFLRKPGAGLVPLRRRVEERP